MSIWKPIIMTVGLVLGICIFSALAIFNSDISEPGLILKPALDPVNLPESDQLVMPSDPEELASFMEDTPPKPPFPGVTGRISAYGSSLYENLPEPEKIDYSSRINTFVNSKRPMIQYCYDSIGKTNPLLDGKIKITFDLGKDGRVTSCDIISNTVGSNNVGDCTCKMLSSWRFPDFEEELIGLVYTFVMSGA